VTHSLTTRERRAEAAGGAPEDDKEDKIVTPERIVEMAELLDIRLNSSEPEFYLLWIAIEAIAAPLPPLWRRLERPRAPAPDEPPAPSAAADGGGGSPKTPRALSKAPSKAPSGKTPARTLSKAGTSSPLAEELLGGRLSPPPKEAAAPAKPLKRRDIATDSMIEIPFAGEGTDARYYYEHSVSGCISLRHPLLPVFEEQTALERRRRDRVRPWSSVEGWMVFAGESDSIYFYNFASRQRTRELPGELVAMKKDREAKEGTTDEAKAKEQKAKMAMLAKGRGAPPPSQREMAQLRKDVALGRPLTQGKMGSKKAKKGAGDQDGATEMAPLSSTAAARAQIKQRAAEITAQTRVWRHVSLQLRPRSLPELLVAAGRFNVDVFAQPAMLWLVDCVIASEYLPMAWGKLTRQSYSALRYDTSYDSKETLSKLSATDRLRFMTFGEVPRYFNSLLRVSTEQHPMVTAVKNADRSLTLAAPAPSASGGGGAKSKAESYADVRSRAEAYR